MIIDAVTAMDSTDAHLIIDVRDAASAFHHCTVAIQFGTFTGVVLDHAQVIPCPIETVAAHGLPVTDRRNRKARLEMTVTASTATGVTLMDVEC